MHPCLAVVFVAAMLPLVALAQDAPELPGLNPPDWLRAYKFEQDKFTFVRIRYDGPRGGFRGRGGLWATDFPDAELNLSAYIGTLTSLQVGEPKTLSLTDEHLADYPFIYLIEPGRLVFREAQVEALRKYLEGGGFLMVDDFWGEEEWENFATEIKRVFPDRDPIDLPPAHPFFHCVFDLEAPPQVPSISFFLNGQNAERPDAQQPNYRAIFDDNGRMLILICHNTDLADGWERISIDRKYTEDVSLAKAIPMGINAVFYALTQGTPKSGED